MKLSKEKRNQLVLVGIMAIALTAVVWQMLIQSSMRRIQSQNELGEKAAKKLRDAQAFLASAAALEEEAVVLSNVLARFESEMAGTADPYTWSVQMIREVNEDHKEVDVQEVSAPQPAAAVQMIGEFPYQAITFGVRGRSHWEDLGRFIAAFENKHPFFRTRKLQLSPDTRTEPAGDEASEASGAEAREKLSFSFDVVALVRPSP